MGGIWVFDHQPVGPIHVEPTHQHVLGRCGSHSEPANKLAGDCVDPLWKLVIAQSRESVG